MRGRWAWSIARGVCVARFFTEHDVLLSPTLCRPPYPLGVLDMDAARQRGLRRGVLAAVGFTSLFNAPRESGNLDADSPGPRASLPLGMQFVAPFGDEATLFRLAAQFEDTWRRSPGRIVAPRSHGWRLEPAPVDGNSCRKLPIDITRAS